MQDSEKQDGQDKCAAKFYSFVLLGKSKARKHSFRDMMRIICERCPSGKTRELLLVGCVTKND